MSNCADYIDNSLPGVYLKESLRDEGAFKCWERDVPTDQATSVASGSLASNTLYYIEDPGNDIQENGVVKLTSVRDSNNNLVGSGDYTILAYQESGNPDNLCGAVDQSCRSVCKAKGGSEYNPATDGYSIDSVTQIVTPGNGPCYKQVEESLKDASDVVLKGNKYPAGFTNDCFLDESGEKYQCVCDGGTEKEVAHGARTAVKKNGDIVEKFVYRQDRLFKESLKTKGTFYPSWRYYAGRDVSGAFGANYLTDYFLDDDSKKFPEVNPQTQYLSAWQTVCVSTIFNQLRLLRSILQGLYGCITIIVC